jgi:hypothetical protein
MSKRNDADATILDSAAGTPGLLQSVLLEDALEDWHLAKDLGELLVRINPGEILGHALLARACRHLGDSERAAEEILECRKLLADSSNLSVITLFESFVAAEQKSGMGGR